MVKTRLFLILGVVALLGQMLGQLSGQVRPVVDAPIAAPAPSTSLPDHPIVPNDLLSINVFDEPGLSKTSRVGKDGAVIMPVLKSSLRVEGMLPREVEAEVSRELLDEQILVHPLVSVSILEYASRMISVVGEVKIPGQFTVTAPITLYEALAKAGWTTNEAGSELLYTKSPSDIPVRINILKLQMGTDPAINLMLTGGEVVNVPEAPKVWVTGNVTKPQAVPIRVPSDATVLKVVASVEGLTQYYNKTAYIYRPDTTGNRKEIPVPLKDIMHRKAQDVALLSDDILLIPDDNGTKRRAMLQLLQTMAGAGASAGTIVGIQR